MKTIDKIWMFFGAVAMAIVASFLFLVDSMSPFVPMPFYMLILAWVLPYGFVIVIMPAIYLIEFKLLSHKKNFGKIILVAASLLFILNILYFWATWEYGALYQGELHVKIIAIENTVGFLSLLLIAYLGIKKDSKIIQYSANLYLLLLLTWCAFPYFGETL
ncbi:hypothetical protein THERMOT_1042 [Bathymodiolus thermophilus thioautotrophic gill symbiont]|uniref:Uncharacterized protein n=1 Tax=Bathymodiolus thermophilus thioautotrophic gill symbiont TaxID=2360 RepID=A0A1J5TWM2_9GAMM|nr:hypothetical protein [Bathymodiolus thermophilus thioautotrophic gill symbiont]OIR25243.1 hypothetical protein BGC33_05855 [Bathymodiolus thermophilus thioautotrophic gill symbiont]CAB5495870.1 hypothetical protein THERMOS_393 [Bathymodiolus thermophilus thioautotrophic gill symbiont]CAB5499452.1 hypothetical protein THERMOT_1042 [Bathymodiolus thermophilus thioautotrophic gill symbiont]